METISTSAGTERPPALSGNETTVTPKVPQHEDWQNLRSLSYIDTAGQHLWRREDCGQSMHYTDSTQPRLRGHWQCKTSKAISVDDEHDEVNENLLNQVELDQNEINRTVSESIVVDDISGLSHKRKAESDLCTLTGQDSPKQFHEGRGANRSAAVARNRHWRATWTPVRPLVQRQLPFCLDPLSRPQKPINRETWRPLCSRRRDDCALDHSAFPHIFAAIVAVAEPSALLALRGASSRIKEMVTPVLLKHLTVSKGMLRSYAGRIWVPDADEHIADAEYIDLAKDVDGLVCLPLCINSGHLSGLRLIRMFSSDAPSFYNPTNILTHSTSVKWIVEFVNMMKDCWTGSVTNSTPASVVYNLDVSGLSSQLAAKEVDLFTASPATPTYILLTSNGQPLSRIMSSSDAKLENGRPLRVRFLNTLLESLVLVWQKWLAVVPLQALPGAKVVFVGADEWDAEWLGRTFCNFLTFRFRVVTETTNLVEPPSENATLQERMLWWIEELAETAGYSDDHKLQLLDSFHFISLDEFEQEVDDRVMFNMIVDRRYGQSRDHTA